MEKIAFIIFPTDRNHQIEVQKEIPVVSGFNTTSFFKNDFPIE